MDLRLEYHRLRHRLGLVRRWITRPQCEYRPLFVIASCRSGSNLLLSYLNQQSGVNMRGEVLYPGVPYGIPRYKVSRTHALWHTRLSLHAQHGPIRGCKLMMYQLRNCKLRMENLFKTFPEARYIILYRAHVGKQFVSQQLAEATNQFVLRLGDKAKHAQVKVDPDALKRFAANLQQDYRWVLNNDWLRDRSVLLSYEELIDNPQHWLEHEIGPMLNLPKMVTPKDEYIQQNSRPLSETVSNFAEVRSLLENCRQTYYRHRPLAA